MDVAEKRSMYNKSQTIGTRRAPHWLVRGLLLASLAASVGACTMTTERDTTGALSYDYRQRHPITIGEKDRTLEIFVGAGRGGLTPTQRAEVLAFAQNWGREATAGVTIDRPVGGANDRASLDTMKQVLSILTSVGIPSHGVGIRPYQAGGVKLAAIKLNYPVVRADAGPCGLWPKDLGPSYDPDHFENRPYYNLGCATQRNLAAQVDNPHDLVQPRAETPAYQAKRTFGTDKWRKGDSPATTYPDANKGTISDLGK